MAWRLLAFEFRRVVCCIVKVRFVLEQVDVMILLVPLYAWMRRGMSWRLLAFGFRRVVLGFASCWCRL